MTMRMWPSAIYVHAVFFISSLRKTASIQVVLSSLVVTFVLLAGGVWNAKCNEAAGYLGAFCAVSALYAAMIILIKIELGYELPGTFSDSSGL
jgi:succinate-acetate transporter protein